MATPLKPWEKNGAAAAASPTVTSTATPLRSNSAKSKSPGQPAVPPRPTSIATATNTNYNSGPYSRYTSGYTTGPTYGGYGMYGSGYGSGFGTGYGYRPYNMYGGTGSFFGQEDSAVLRQAEERTRAAFQSVESVVGAVGSISMMLESTYVAVHSCFRALIGVAEQFSRLRNHIWSILSAIAIIRRLTYLLKRLLRFLRLRPYLPEDETWDGVSALSTPVSLTSQVQQSSQRLWPVLTFFTVIVGVPWLLWRLVTSISTDEATSTTDNTWSGNVVTNGESSTCIARALYNFTAEGNNELSINAGDELVVAPRQFQPNITGWVMVGRNRKSGLVPANYIEIIPGQMNRSASTKTTPSPAAAANASSTISDE